jgi:hypothetical protein
VGDTAGVAERCRIHRIENRVVWHRQRQDLIPKAEADEDVRAVGKEGFEPVRQVARTEDAILQDTLARSRQDRFGRQQAGR